MKIPCFIFIILLFPIILVFAETEDTEDLLNKGRESMFLQEFEKALTYFDKVLELEQDNVKALINKGSVLLQLDKLDEAVYYYDRALEIDPDNISALNNKGSLLLKQDKKEEAIELFGKALEINPDYEPAKSNLDLAFNGAAFRHVTGSLEVTLRDQQGNLLVFLKSNRLTALDSYFADTLFGDWDVIRTISKNGQKYQVIQYTREMIIDEETAYGAHQLVLLNTNTLLINVFAPQVPVKVGDKLTHVFTLERLVD